VTEWQGLTIPQLDGFTGFAPPQGNGSYKVVVQIEALGEHEARDGVNLHPNAPAGSVFNRLVQRAGLERENFVIWNSVWSRPPRNWLEGSPWEGQAIASYAPFRDKAFEMYRPRIFVALGNVALKTLTPYGQGKTSISHTQGYVLDGPYDGTHVIGTFHPSAIMQGLQGLSGVFMWALQRAVELARTGFVREPLNLITHPSLDDMLAFERNFNPDVHRLDFDIETPESGDLPEEDLAEEEDEETSDEKREISFTIVRCSFCYDGVSITIPWATPYREIAMRLFAKAKRLGVWNEDFDVPRIVADGAQVNARIYDWMKLWKHLQPGLPGKLKCRALEFVAPFYGWTGEPWKSLNHSQPEFYNACDSLALYKCGNGIEHDLRSKGQWQLFERHVVDLYPVLQKMGRNGLPYDSQEAAAFDQRLGVMLDERDAELQRRVPDSVKPSKQKQGYKKPPQDTTGLTRRSFKVVTTDLTKAECVELFGVETPPYVDIVSIERWCLLEPFNPNSPGEGGQLAMLVKHFGHTIGKDRKSKKGSVNTDVINKLIKKCKRVKRDRELAELLQMCKEYKQLTTVRSRYVKGWHPGADGRIHATPGFWGKMYRISWRRPNISATVQDKQEDYIAAGFRKCVRARPGHVLLDVDWRGIEAILTGWFAQDEVFMRLGRLGVHDYFCYHLLAYRGKLTVNDIPSLSLSDDDLRVAFKRVKKEFPKDRDDSKHIVHGIDYGETPYLIHMLYEIPMKEAIALHALHGEVFPKVKKWQKETLDRASRESRLRNPFGVEMPFWEVFRWDSRKQIWALGDDAKSALSFLPRDTAACMLKEVCLRPAIQQLVDEGIVLATHHDAFMGEPREDAVMQVAQTIVTEMEQPVPELGGLVINAEAKVGVSWHEADMETLDLHSLTVA
jgi:uracil-DNA glycosylase family 4